MRIAQIVRLISADNALGGPLTVALEQSAALRRRGHDVTLLAGWDGIAAADGAHVHPVRQLVPSLPLTGMTAPGLLAELARTVRGYDAVHVHLGRDLVTMPAALLAGRRLVAQTHGMITADDRSAARVMDAAATRRALRRAGAVLYLTDAERDELQQIVGGAAALRYLANGIAAEPAAPKETNDRPRILFLARLHPRKRVGAFLEMASRLRTAGVDADFAVAGPDEGDLPAVRQDPGVTYLGALDPAAARRELARADVYVLPSFGEIVPMSVLEALAAGTPTVITEDCGLAEDLRRRGAARVTDGSVDQLVDAVRDLLTNPAAATRQRAAGAEAIRTTYSIDAVAAELERVYEFVSAGRRRS